MPEQVRNVVIVGATSAIAEALARRLAVRGDVLLLTGRDTARLAAIADDLRVRGAKAVHVATLDVNRLDEHARFVDHAWRTLGRIDVILIAHGTLPDQKACEASAARTIEEINTNFVSTISLLTLLANALQAQGVGTIAVVTSVAGDRGRKSNYVYGTAKGGVSRFLEGLRHRLHPFGVKVVDIKPGFVDTPMTAAFRKGALWATPKRVARDIERSLNRGDAVLYTPWFWRWIMLLVRLLPNVLFHRTGL